MRITLTAGILSFAMGMGTVAQATYDFSQADGLYGQRRNSPDQIKKAVDSYTAALSATLTNDEKAYAIEQASALHVYHGYIVDQEDIDLRVQIAENCLALVAKIDPSRGFVQTPQYYYWKAACMMARANAKGVSQSLRDAGPALELIETGIDLDSTYEGGGFDRLAGLLYAKLPFFNPFGPSGDLDKAFMHFRNALASDAYLHPLNPSWRDEATETGDYFYSTHFYYAEALVKNSQKPEAKQVLEDALAAMAGGRVSTGRGPEAEVSKLKMQELLRQL